MAFVAISNLDIAAAEPVKQELWQTVKDDLDDHESRIGNLELAVANFVPIEFHFNGLYWKYVTPQTAVMYDRLTFTINILAARLTIWKAGTSGTTEVDVLYKTGAGAFTSIFTTKPSVGFAAGDLAVSTNAVLTSTPITITAGSFLRVDLTSAQSGGDSATLQLEYEVT